ncbi:MAG: crosslink repair DNA glycosylase YcaQ family protein [Phenylobacterium sp.]
MTPVRLTAAQAVRIVLAAQGLAGPPPAGPVGPRQVLKTIERLGVLQIDSVNVLARAHYLPLFARLGPYPRAALDELAWGRRPKLFEYWAHEASLMPLADWPLMRWRMEDAARGVRTWKGVARLMAEQPQLLERALAEVGARGPIGASDIDWGPPRERGWWGWNEPKRAIEALFWMGRTVAAGRRASFERTYALPAAVLPRAVLEAPVPERADAQRRLVAIAARALGVATELDLADYFRMSRAETRVRIAELVEAGALIPAAVNGWDQPAWLDPAARRPRKASGRALLAPFDNLIFSRQRALRLFGLHYRIGIYTPADKRTHGYYVLPFLEGEAITAQVDLKADRKAGVLIVQAAHAEPAGANATPHALAAELRRMAAWLELEDVRVAPRGDLAAALEGALQEAPPQAEDRCPTPSVTACSRA